MYRFDGHVHTLHSFDSKAAMALQCAAAAEAGLHGLCFAEHFSLDPLVPTFGHLDWASYNADLARCREAYAGKLVISRGIELCEPHTLLPEYGELLARERPDAVLGSIHNVAHTKLRALVANHGAQRAFQLYFEEYLRMATCADIDVAAHLDLAKRYTGAAFSERTFLQNQALLEEILKTIIARGIALEMNTSSLEALGEGMPSRLVLSLYAELGGELLTFGSDAHSPGRVAQGFSESAVLARELGFPGFCVFTARVPVLHPFSELQS